MTSVTTLDEAEQLLARFVPLSRNVTGRDITLNRMRPLMELLGNPEKRLKIVHVAGTSGKTSTSYFIANLLTLAGQKTGLTISPHIDSVTERVQINLQPIGEYEFTRALNEYMQILESSNLEPTYFELLISFAYWYFAKVGVDYAVIETGMGGLHDGTNVADNPDKVCVITDIGLDHMNILGSTVSEIAKQKAGIIHAGNKVFMFEQTDEISNVIQEQVEQVGADLSVIPDESDTEMPDDLPEFQARNWNLAFAVFDYIKNRDELTHTNIEQSLKTVVPARMDIVNAQGKTIVMDGAHNEQKMQAFVNSFQQLYPDIKVPVMLALKQGKELAAVLPLLKPLTSKLIVTEYKPGQDLPIGPIDAEELKAAASRFGFEDSEAVRGINEAYSKLLECEGDVAIVTGSFYLIGQLRAGHKELVR